MKLYRAGNYFYNKHTPLIPKLINGLIRFIHNCAIYSETKIGVGTQFGYGGIGVVIHKRSVISERVVIGTNVTVGSRSRSDNSPVIGDNVFIATGAKILGDIKVGNNSVIGANAVVIHDVPENSVVAGLPAKVIKLNINPKDFY